MDISKVISLVDTKKNLNGTTVIGIDGLAGSGKSTLASKLASIVSDVQIVELDHFYKSIKFPNSLLIEIVYDAYFDWQRLIKEVLVPLSMNEESCFGKMDWETGIMVGSEPIKSGGVVIVEGVYAMRPEIRCFYDLKLYVETPKTLRKSRIDNRKYPDESWVSYWMDLEDWYFNNQSPYSYVDLVINGDQSPINWA